MSVQAATKRRLETPKIDDLCQRLMARDQNTLGPILAVTQSEVDLFTSLTGDRNPLHKPGANRLGPKAVVPGLMLGALVPRLSGFEFPFELDGLNLVNRMTRFQFRLPVFVGQPIRMRFHPVGEPKQDYFGKWIEIGFSIVETEKVHDLVRGEITLGYA